MSVSDKDKLKQFYFSTSSNFGAYAKTKPAKTTQDTTAGSNVSMSGIDVSMISNQEDHQQQVTSPDVGSSPMVTIPHSRATGGSGINAVRSSTSTPGITKKPASTSSTPLPNAASPGYFNFLKQQQDLQKHHNQLEAATSTLENDRRNRQAELVKLRRESKELLKALETSTDWCLHSKYDTQQLIRDSSLALQPVELVDEKKPQLAAMEQLAHQLEKQKAERETTPQYSPHQLFVDQGLRRISLLNGTLKEDGHMDYTTVSRIPDTLLIQLQNVCDLATADSLIDSFEDAIDLSTFKADEARKKREVAVSDGEVHIAEKLCYDVVQHHEEMLTEVIAKAAVLEQAIKENTVLLQANENYVEKTVEEFEQIRVRMAKLRVRCEGDLQKMFALRSKVEEVEGQTAKKVIEERERTDVLLKDNTGKVDVIFVKMEELEKELATLERERHRIVQRRVQEKDKDEHRKAEFAQFCQVLEDHTVPLQRTIANMDLMVHGTEVLQEFVNNGFSSLRDDLTERSKVLKDVKLEAHKQHVEVMRGLTLEVGDVVYRKERMVEETDKNIQQAHVQQELLAETFNPSAKKYGTVKKRLMVNRDELEIDIKELKERAEDALAEFRPSEDALAEAGVEYVHPVTEQQHHALAMRTKMMEFKAVIAGQTHGSAILADLTMMKSEVSAAQSELDNLNANTTGTMSKSLPMIRAAMKARSQK